MADDRVAMVCNSCGGWVTLMRYSQTSGLSMRGFAGSDKDWRKMASWVDEHSMCHASAVECKDDLGGDPGWSLKTEDCGALTGDMYMYSPERDAIVEDLESRADYAIETGTTGIDS